MASGGLLQVAWQRYMVQLKERPLRTKAITGACISCLSDVVAQNILHGRHQNWRRTAALSLFGFFWASPSAHYWQKLMDYMFKGKTDFNTVLKKVVVDQATYGPLCNFLFISYATLVLEGQSMAALIKKLKNDFWTVQLNGWRFWPVVGLINYKYVPLKLRVLFINLAALCWTTFLLLKSKGATKAKKS